MAWQEEDGGNAAKSLIDAFFNSSPEPCLVIIKERIVECNEAALNILGYETRGDLINKSPAVISPEFQPSGDDSYYKSKEHINIALSKGMNQFEWVHKRQNGSHFTVVVTLYAVESNLGLIVYVTWRDVSENKQLHASLMDSETRLNQLFKSMPSAILFLLPDDNNQDYYVTKLNYAAERIFSPDNSKQMKLSEFFPHQRKIAEEIIQSCSEAQTGRAVIENSVILSKGSGIYSWLDFTIYKISTGELVVVVEDNTEQQIDREKLELYACVYKQSKNAIIITNKNNKILSVNSAFTELTGYSEGEVLGLNPCILSSGYVKKQVYREMWKSLGESGYWEGELWDKSKDGRVYPKWTTINVVYDSKGCVKYYIADFSDITKQKTAEEKIHKLAYQDSLTGLLNRYSFELSLASALESSRINNNRLAVSFIDLDYFKDINDSYGHHVGDKLLIAVAERLKKSVRESDIVARISGDEFVVVFSDFSQAEFISSKISNILNLLTEKYEIDDKKLHCTPSIGVSVFPEDGQSAGDLIKNADAAMYHAKSLGRKTYQFFSKSIELSTKKRMQLGQDLYSALEKNEFEMFYQPQVDSVNSTLCGLEALIRWNHPQKGTIPPNDFIPVLEQSGLIEPVGEWVIEEVCRQIALWRSSGLNEIYIAINISAKQLRSQKLVSFIKEAMHKHDIPKGFIELEVTESVAMDDPEQAIDRLSQLENLGISIALDDFGTGYSSLAYLKKLPLNKLKLDREFVRDIETDENDSAISSATIALAHSLGLKTVAEGVETHYQCQFLRNNSCDIFQGYLFGKPLPVSELEKSWGDSGLFKS